MKFTLSFTVVFTCVICYMLAPKVASYDWTMILILTFAGLCITGSANAINQAVEKDTDAVMKRTAKRPVANGSMSQQEAYIFAFIAGVLGVAMMWYFFNLSAALVSAFSLFLYSFILFVREFPWFLLRNHWVKSSPKCVLVWFGPNNPHFCSISKFFFQYL